MKCIFICAYFGKLPSHFQLWLNSCGYNKNYTFIIITDDKTNYEYPDNVKVEYVTFKQLCFSIQSKFDFEICLKNPYKLCDFKPAYGYIFSDKIIGYDFWGHCDIDTIIGNLDSFLTEEVFSNYEKVFFLGHMTLYRNTEANNRRFMNKIHEFINYKNIFEDSKNYAFDELPSYGINKIYEELKIPIYKKEVYADISCMHYNTYTVYYDFKKKDYYELKEKQIFSFEDGRVFGYKIKRNKIQKEEYAYIHIQKRLMKINVGLNDKKYLISPKKYETFTNPTQKIIKNRNKTYRLYFPYFKYKYKAFKYRIAEFFNHLNRHVRKKF